MSVNRGWVALAVIGCHHKLAEHRFGHSGLARRGRMAGDAILVLKTELRSLMAQSGHVSRSDGCLLSEVKQT